MSYHVNITETWVNKGPAQGYKPITVVSIFSKGSKSRKPLHTEERDGHGLEINLSGWSTVTSVRREHHDLKDMRLI